VITEHRRIAGPPFFTASKESGKQRFASDDGASPERASNEDQHMSKAPALKPWSVSTPVQSASLTSLLFVLVIVGCVYIGREVLVPIALAVLLSFALAPPVELLQRWRVPRAVAVIGVVLFAFAGVFSLGGLMISQVNQLASDLPRYQSTLHEKIQSLRGVAAGSGTLERASEVLQNLSREIDRPNSGVSSTPAAPSVALKPADRPIPVEVRQPDAGALQTLAALISPLIHPLETTGIVVIFIIFILLQRQDLRNRLVRLAGSRDLQRTTAAIDDAAQRLSQLFLTQLALNAAFGLVIGTGLWLIGVPSSALWGILAMVLRFVPYIGPPISAIFPLVLAAAVGTGWGMVLWTAALFLVVESIIGQAIEPVVFGHRTGLSPVAIIVSATFWTWLWGPIGLILATPLTVCLVVLGRHVDRFKFLDVMLGDQPPLTPPELTYQRMLAGDSDEAAEQAEEFLKEESLLTYYEKVLLEALKLAQADADRGLLDNDRLSRVRDAVIEIVDDLSTHKDEGALTQTAIDDAEERGPLAHIALAEQSLSRNQDEIPINWRNGKPVLCVPGVGLLDEAFTAVVAQIIERQGIAVRTETRDALSVARIFTLDTTDVELLCVCYLTTVTPAQIRYSIRRLRRKVPDKYILVTTAGALDVDSVGLFPLAEQGSLVQGSLIETAMKVRSIAVASTELKEAPLYTSIEQPASHNSTGRTELRAI
jgi:predicted PurR-regulated permease PerM